MRRIFLLIITFSLLFGAITFLNYELEKVDNKLKKISIANKSLEDELSFLKTEWEYINSPNNISILSKEHFDYSPAELMEMSEFMQVLLNKKK
tara:strand:- start:384 stop:662 length:279 start_codon:yes stop_codon:yes gene_type:complete